MNPVGKKGKRDAYPTLFNRLSGQQVRDDLTAGYDSIGPLELVEDFGLGSNSQSVVDRRDDVARNEWMCGREGSRAVAGAVDQSALEAAAGHHQAVAEVPVVSAPLVAVHFWSPPEIAQHGDQRAVEHSARGQIIDQAGIRSVELRQQGRLERFEIAAVRVPRRVGVGCPGDRDDARSRFDQPLRGETGAALEDRVVAIGGAWGLGEIVFMAAGKAIGRYPAGAARPVYAVLSLCWLLMAASAVLAAVVARKERALAAE